jgi:hypothetical protein
MALLLLLEKCRRFRNRLKPPIRLPAKKNAPSRMIESALRPNRDQTLSSTQ